MTEDRKNKIIELNKEYFLILESVRKLNKDLKKILDDECDYRDDLENSEDFISNKNYEYVSDVCDDLNYVFEQAKKIITPIKNINRELTSTIKLK